MSLKYEPASEPLHISVNPDSPPADRARRPHAEKEEGTGEENERGRRVWGRSPPTLLLVLLLLLRLRRRGCWRRGGGGRRLCWSGARPRHRFSLLLLLYSLYRS